MELTKDLLTFTPAPVEPPVDAEWYRAIVRKRAEREALLKPWSARPHPDHDNEAVPLRPRRNEALFTHTFNKADTLITGCSPQVLLNRLADRSWSAEEVLKAFIKQAVVAQKLTNALSEIMFDYGLQQARELDKKYAETGKPVGPLHGLPLSIKDTFDVEGYDSTAGWAALIGKPARSTAKLIQKLQESGAVIYCKTNVPQTLMSGECVNYVFGRTSTPFNATLSAGGSSGGEGALISMGGSPLGIGTDIAGSIRTPSNFNGIYGLTPTSGRLPFEYESGMEGIKAVHGPLSRSVEGLEVYVQSLLATKPWTWDHATVNLPWRSDEYEEGMAWNRPLVIGVLRHDGVVLPHPPIQRCLEDVVQKLRNAGHIVVEFAMRDTQEMMDVMFRMFGSAGDVVEPLQSILQEPLIKEIDHPTSANAISAADYFTLNMRKIRLRRQFLLDWMRTASVATGGRPIDSLIMPSGGHVAPPHGSMTYFAYEAISNVLDLPCATFPVNVVRSEDSLTEAEFRPMSAADAANWAKWDSDAYSNGPICLQAMGNRYGEEKLLGVLRTIDRALGRAEDYQAGFGSLSC